ncbi:MAG: class I adenylate-forming enzyme family protein [Bacilli bacterium]|nr:class I adenylate-forming enzyme family protein [Bacilli bacterium]MDD4406767.1 class I adenylate-forming enzyme family protein [Bacilli bacterium]
MKVNIKNIKESIKHSANQIHYEHFDSTPWFKYYEKLNIPKNLVYPELTLYEMIEETAAKYPSYYAYEYFGKYCTYQEFIEKIKRCAKSFQKIGVKENDKVTICMPNVPEGIIAIYALNLIGAVANMTHPLSSESELEFYLKKAKSKYILTMDFVYEKLCKIENEVNLKKVILAKASDSMNAITTAGYWLTSGRKIKVKNKQSNVISWKNFIYEGRNNIELKRSNKKDSELAIILYSGGTTGTPKGIMLSSRNFNAIALQNRIMCRGTDPGESILSIMPIFHGFGLGICFHTAFTAGMKTIIIPKFTASSFAKLIKTYKPNFIAGVPTLYEALLQTEFKEGALEGITGVVCGGDTLTPELQKRVNEFIKKYGSKTEIQVGWGMTECVASTIATPIDNFIPGSIGVPAPDNFVKIVKSGTTENVYYNQDGEICLHSPAVMLGYLDNEKETKMQLKKHEDGKIWLHTGDIGSIDKTGMIFFKSRLKRIIISSGYNIYPNYVEAIINKHPKVLTSIVVGKPHSYKGEVAIAYIVLKPEYKLTDKIDNDINSYCKQNIAKYSLPVSIEYRETLPMTKVGKIDYRQVK